MRPCPTNHEKINCCINFLLKGGLYNQRTGWANFDELRVTDSTLNEGIGSRVTGESDPGG